MRWAIFAAIVGASLAAPASGKADPYTVLGTTPGSLFILDQGTVSREGPSATVTYYVIKRDVLADGSSYQALTVDADCDARRMRIRKLIAFGRDGAEINSIEAKTKWTDADVGVSAHVVAQACGAEQGQPLLYGDGKPMGLGFIVQNSIDAMRNGDLK